MIKTLHITGILAAGLAVVFFVLPVVFGGGSDEEKEKFLNSAGAIQTFTDAKDAKQPRKDPSRLSPLVKEAKAFALYLNPPPTPKRKPQTRSPRSKARARPRPKVVTAKFELIGTSFYASDPQLSLALIAEPGKNMHWVRQSSKVGHLIIEEVKDGQIIVRDGKRTFPLVTKRPPKKSLVKNDKAFKIDYF